MTLVCNLSVLLMVELASCSKQRQRLNHEEIDSNTKVDREQIWCYHQYNRVDIYRVKATKKLKRKLYAGGDYDDVMDVVDLDDAEVKLEMISEVIVNIRYPIQQSGQDLQKFLLWIILEPAVPPGSGSILIQRNTMFMIHLFRQRLSGSSVVFQRSSCLDSKALLMSDWPVGLRVMTDALGCGSLGLKVSFEDVEVTDAYHPLSPLRLQPSSNYALHAHHAATHTGKKFGNTVMIQQLELSSDSVKD
ncbi:hypothetical protein PPACK8108_LOCUS13450 [Phakopsora pachyrhizi]|uniref:Uncharacterized protein n=1 Tax=Phakopsora pachyrhizi TaxID=170000 RepID=A0AAV0B6P1_PHAPC|nr:hypothetical protein PPACK8108_LOCUS13450 [Phakopsora pachyrhizi]